MAECVTTTQPCWWIKPESPHHTTTHDSSHPTQPRCSQQGPQQQAGVNRAGGRGRWGRWCHTSTRALRPHHARTPPNPGAESLKLPAAAGTHTQQPYTHTAACLHPTQQHLGLMEPHSHPQCPLPAAPGVSPARTHARARCTHTLDLSCPGWLSPAGRQQQPGQSTGGGAGHARHASTCAWRPAGTLPRQRRAPGKLHTSWPEP